jgi:hypothetical protein
VTSQDTAVHRYRGRIAPYGAILGAAAALALLAGCAAGSATPTATSTESTASPVSATSAVSPSAGSVTLATMPKPTQPAGLPVAPPDAATKPQTDVEPSTSGTAFKNATHDIWLAVSTGDSRYALPAFFPEKAYLQVKAIANQDADWTNRLWLDFTLDVAAVHKLIGPGAKLTRITVPTQYAQWIPPGACANTIGYWHAPGARLVYQQGGATRSFGLASFISWRGVWYLIHLGALVRAGAYGIVDDPEAGPGIPGPAGGC